MERADLHIHSCASDGTYHDSELLEGLVENGITVAAITDHDKIAGAHAIAQRAKQRDLPIEIIIGEEITSREGHIVGIFLNERIRPKMSAKETLEAIHAQGGLAILAHPERHISGQRAITLLEALPFDGLEIGSLFDYREHYIARWRNANRKQWKLAEIASSDAHTKHFFGRAYTEFPGSGAHDLRQAIKRRLTRPVYHPFTNAEKWAIRFTYARHTSPYYLLGGAIEIIEDLFKGRL